MVTKPNSWFIWRHRVLCSLCVATFCFLAHGTTEFDRAPPKDHRFFLQQIFDKYGHRGVMTFEGFEHLLENLGLGQLEFEKNHTVSLHKVNGTFNEVHDQLALHQHDHGNVTFSDFEEETTTGTPKQKRAGGRRKKKRQKRRVKSADGEVISSLEELLNEHKEAAAIPVNEEPSLCLSPQDILMVYGLEPYHSVINQVNFLHLCPSIIYELDHRSCYRVQDMHGHHNREEEGRKSNSVWLYATLSILLMSLIGLSGAALIPIMQALIFQQLLNFLVALAVGTLAGDALLHLLPHALGLEDNDKVALWRAGGAFLAILAFFLLERCMKHFSRRKELRKKTNERDRATSEWKKQKGEELSVESGVLMPEAPEETHGHSHNIGTGVASVAWMVIMGDGLHNLTDGMAVGAAFAGSIVTGVSTALAVLCHELPHELGDFAVLLKSGMSIKQAIAYNLFSSVLSFIGMAAGVLLGNFHSASDWIFAATAGTFLYIALVDLVPELDKYGQEQESSSIWYIVLQLTGILTGGSIMFVIGLYEENLKELIA